MKLKKAPKAAAAVWCTLALSAGVCSAAVGATKCVAGSATPSDLSNAPREASRLLRQVRYDSQQVSYEASELRDYSTHTQMDSIVEGRQLDNIRAHINHMGKDLCKLNTLQNGMEPRQRRALNEVTPLVQYLADNADAAIGYVNTHTRLVWEYQYRKNVQNLHAEANTISRDLRPVGTHTAGTAGLP